MAQPATRARTTVVKDDLRRSTSRLAELVFLVSCLKAQDFELRVQEGEGRGKI